MAVSWFYRYELLYLGLRAFDESVYLDTGTSWNLYVFRNAEFPVQSAFVFPYRVS